MKKLAGITAVIIIFLIFNIRAYAVNTDGYLKDGLEASGIYELTEYLNGETLDYLEKLGLEEIEYEKLLSVSPQSVFELLTGILKGKLAQPFKTVMKCLATVILAGVCTSFAGQDEKMKGVLNTVCASFTVISIFSSGYVSVSAGASAIGSCAAFEKALIPVLAGVVTASGNPTLAFSVQGTAFVAAQAIEALASNIILPLSAVTGALGIIGAISPSVNLGAVAELIKKTSTTVIGGASGLFTGFLAMKSVVAGSADRVASRGIRLAAGTFIPVVGSALGEAYSSVVSSLSLVKNIVGVYAIIAFFIICIPVIAELFLWNAAMKTCSAFSDLLGTDSFSKIFKSAGYVFSMVNVLLVFSAVVFIVTTGIVITVRAGA